MATASAWLFAALQSPSRPSPRAEPTMRVRAIDAETGAPVPVVAAALRSGDDVRALAWPSGESSMDLVAPTSGTILLHAADYDLGTSELTPSTSLAVRLRRATESAEMRYIAATGDRPSIRVTISRGSEMSRARGLAAARSTEDAWDGVARRIVTPRGMATWVFVRDVAGGFLSPNHVALQPGDVVAVRSIPLLDVDGVVEELAGAKLHFPRAVADLLSPLPWSPAEVDDLLSWRPGLEFGGDAEESRFRLRAVPDIPLHVFVLTTRGALYAHRAVGESRIIASGRRIQVPLPLRVGVDPVRGRVDVYVGALDLDAIMRIRRDEQYGGLRCALDLRDGVSSFETFRSDVYTLDHAELGIAYLVRESGDGTLSAKDWEAGSVRLTLPSTGPWSGTLSLRPTYRGAGTVTGGRSTESWSRPFAGRGSVVIRGVPAGSYALHVRARSAQDGSTPPAEIEADAVGLMSIESPRLELDVAANVAGGR